jgi:hypothetical protein
MLGALGRYLRQLRVAYVLLLLAAALAGGLLLAQRGGPHVGHPEPLTIGGPGPRACATAVVREFRPVEVTVRRSASLAEPLIVTVSRTASATGRRGPVRASATASERITLTQSATAAARVPLRLRASARGSACAPGQTTALARRRAQLLARRVAGKSAARLLQERFGAAIAAAQQGSAPQLSARAVAQARRALNARAAAAQASAESAAAAAAEREAARRARQAAGA